MAAVYFFEHSRSKSYNTDMRWRMVWSEAYERPNLWTNSCEFKSGSFNGMENCPKVRGGWHCWGQETRRGKTLTVYDELLIIQSVLDNPSIYLHELWCRVEETTSTNVTESAICRFLHCKKLAKIVSQRSEELREKFLIDCSVYEPEMLVFVDETGCDRHSAVRRFAIPLEVCLFPLTIVCYYPNAQYTQLVKIRPHTCAISSHITFSPIKQ